MKSIWQGSLSFGLVTVPVQLFSAIKIHSIGFKLLHKVCKTPIVYERWCKHCNKQVSWDDIVKGLELPDGTYFIVTHEKLKSLKPVKTDELVIKEFIHQDQLEILYTNDHYYLIPTPKGERAYLLLHRALEKMNAIAIGTFVMREKEHVCAITAYRSILLVTTLHYAYEIQPLPIKKSPTKKIDIEEEHLAQELIKKRITKHFDLTQYKDTFAQRLLAAIKASKKRTKIKTPKKAVEKKEEKVIAHKESLVKALRSSLQASSGKRSRKSS